MAVSNGYDLSVRQALQNKGVDNSAIGYNNATGYVTVNGQNFMKPAKSYEGTSYTSQNDFNNAWNTYSQPKAVTPSSISSSTATITPQATATGRPAPTGYTASTTSYSPYNTSNPYDSKFQQQYDLISNLVNQAPVSVQDIYNSPAYAAYQASAAKDAQAGIRAAQESMGASGFGRSTQLSDRAQGIQNDANAYLETQVLPQLLSNAQNERQQTLQNQMSLLDSILGQQGVYDNRYNSANDLAIQKGQLTGNYLDPQASALVSQILNAKNNYANAQTAEDRQSINSEANKLRSALAALGYGNVDQLLGAGVTSAQASANANQFGQRTLAGQAQDQQQAQQQWENNFNSAQFDWQKAQQAWENAFQEKNFQQSIKQFAEQMGYDWATLSQRQQESIADMAFKQKQFEYEMQQDAAASSSGADVTKAFNNVADIIDKSLQYVEDNRGNKTLANGEAIERQIMNSGLPEYQMWQLYQRYGLPWNGDIPSPN